MQSTLTYINRACCFVGAWYVVGSWWVCDRLREIEMKIRQADRKAVLAAAFLALLAVANLAVL